MTNIVTVYTPTPFGVGNGVDQTFQLGDDRQKISSVGVTGVWRQDWQGNSVLLPTPRTNLLSYSQTLDASVWTNSRLIVTAGAIAAPDGSLTGYKLADNDSTTGARNLNQACASGVSATTLATFSIYAHAAERSFVTIRLQCRSIPGDYCAAWFDLSTQTFNVANVGTASGATGTIKPLGNGWFRCSVTGAASGSGSGFAGLIGAPVTYGNSVNYAGVPGQGVYFWGAQLETNSPASPYIATAATQLTVTDYSISQSGMFTLGQTPSIGAILTWTGHYAFDYIVETPTLAQRTIISQYATSPTLVQLCNDMDDYFNPDADLDMFYDYVWNVMTAQGFGLDIWGQIVNVERQLTIPGAATYLGFDEAYTAPTKDTGPQPFGQAPFWTGSIDTETYALTDDAYRTLILVKALANISDCTAASLNQLLQNLFQGRGRCYVNDLGDMQMRFTFEFFLQPFEMAIMTQSNAIPRPAAVQVSIAQIPVPNVFGFSEAGTDSAAPFNQGTFFTGVINAN